MDFPDVAFRASYPVIGPLVRQLDGAELAHIDVLGLTHLRDMPDLRVNHDLLTALVEHFHSETNTFHLPQGEMTVTPEDVYRILRVPFHGPRVEYDTQSRVGAAALRTLFQDDTIMGRAIP